jgi:acetyl esterase/lipase
MNTDRLKDVDESLRDVLSLLPDFSRLGLDTLAEFRALPPAVPPVLGVVDGVDVSQIETTGTDGRPVAGYLFRPVKAAPGHPAVLNIHGGGYVMGKAEREYAWSLRCAQTLGCTVFSPEYAKAPEAPFPAPSDDCLAALEWLHASAADLGVDPSRIALRGVSAGGGLAAGLTVRTRGRADIPIAYLVLIYPMLDHKPSPPDRAGHHVWPREANVFGWASLLGDSIDNPSPVAVPALAGDLSAFPPTFLAVGDIDLFITENLAFAARLVEAGIETELHVYPGAYHGFNMIAGSPLSQRFEAETLAALSRAFSR